MNSWTLLLATPLFAYQSSVVANFGFYAPYLLVPFAALLGRRYAVSGVVSIALGGLVLVITIGGYWGVIGGSPALYLIAMAVAAIAAIPRPLIECLRWPEEDRAASWLTFATPFLLVLFIGIRSPGPFGNSLQVSFNFGFGLLGYFLLFILGARGIRMAALLLGLVATAALSWFLTVKGLVMRPQSPLYASISPLHPSTVLAALATVLSGAATESFLSGRSPAKFWQRPYLAVTALLFLWFGPPPIAAIPVGLESVRFVNILQVAAALPLAAFMAGLHRGARGTIFVTAFVTVLTIAWSFGSAFFRIGQVALEAPFVAAAYALMGAKAAEIRSGAVDFRMLRLPTFLFLLFLLVLGATLVILDDGGPVRVALSGLFVLGVIVVFILALRLRRVMVARGFDMTSEKWAPFVAILGVLGTVVMNLQTVGELLRQLFVLVLLPLSVFSPSAKAALLSYFGGSIDSEMLVEIIVAGAICLIAFILVVRGFLRVIPKIYGDTRKIAAFVQQWRHRGTT